MSVQQQTVLFVDDEASMLKALVRASRRLRPDWHYYHTDSPMAWSEPLDNGPQPDIIISDYLMPFMNGDQVLEQAMVVYPRAIRVLLTGQTSSDVFVKQSRLAHYILSKPFSDLELEDIFKRSEYLASIPLHERIKYFLGYINYLIPLPEIVEKINRLLSSEDYQIEQLADLIAEDPATASRIVTLANSSFLGYHNQVVSLTDAIKRVGVKLTHAIVLASTAENAYAKRISINEQQTINHRAFDFAMHCQSVAQELGLSKTTIESLFLAALFTGIGKYIKAIDSKDLVANEEFVTLLKAQDEWQLCAYVMTLWGLPHDICHLISMMTHPSDLLEHHLQSQSAIILFGLYCKSKGEPLPPEWQNHLPGTSTPIIDKIAAL
ncbi:HD-like signal output (HDOD) domain, no enzymatic activity [Aeromonas sp. RU39B]|uniref:HDOD domain-containing protein n=1 Tax=Aeromonas sp. RU39B TaxID=1907416 RepID=UPI0009570F2B|nr:HDOD domain-containing protein [Aeromonas sp. RU39B]SIR04771.1 HD-like signal output (HDOD) domain, no enzymatic activity [Aeromonas sp. RU39B]